MRSSDPAYYEAHEDLESGEIVNSLSTDQIRTIQIQLGQDPCFLTNKRLLCREEACEWKHRCRRLIAVWKR